MKHNLFTLILLVKGRHEFTERWLIYMSNIKFKYDIIIADGKNDGITQKLIEKINCNKDLLINFCKYDTNAGYKNYYEMRYDALSKVKTKYVMLCDNDDFILPGGIDELINFLEPCNYQNQKNNSCNISGS